MPHRISWKMRYFELGLVVLAMFLFIGAGDQQSRFERLGHELMCECGCNQVLLECNHVGCPLSDGMRRELASYIARGDSDNLVLQAFVQKYGPTVLLAPTNKGFNRVAWIVPYLTLALGLMGVVVVIRAWKARPLLPRADAVPPVSGEELEHFREQARRDTEL